MEKKTSKRKLIGFVAGEKGSIGKLQALGLGAAGLVASGLLIPLESAEADTYVYEESGVHVNEGSIDFTVGEGRDYTTYEQGEWDRTGTVYEEIDTWSFHVDNGFGTSHIDHHDYSGYYAYSDWAGDWHNAPPSVSIEVR